VSRSRSNAAPAPSAGLKEFPTHMPHPFAYSAYN
jgi:hypothetical protein